MDKDKFRGRERWRKARKTDRQIEDTLKVGEGEGET